MKLFLRWCSVALLAMAGISPLYSQISGRTYLHHPPAPPTFAPLGPGVLPQPPAPENIDVSQIPAEIADQARLANRCHDEFSASSTPPRPLSGPFPTMGKDSDSRTDCFWLQHGLQVLRSAKMTSTTGQGVASAEIASDTFGPVRVLINTAVSGSSKEEQQGQTVTPTGQPLPTDTEAERHVRQLITNGGNLSAMAQLPVYLREWVRGDLFVNSYVRFGTTVPVLGETGDSGASRLNWEDFNGNLETAVESELSVIGKQKVVDVVLFGRGAFVSGTSLFNRTIKNIDSKNNLKSNFAYAQLGGGIRVKETILVLITWNGYSNSHLPGKGAAFTLSIAK